jgi:hypothetical protein
MATPGTSMRIFLNVAIILIILAALGWAYMSVETEKYWREKIFRPPAKK